MTTLDLINNLSTDNIRSLAKLLSIVESNAADSKQVLSSLFPKAKNAVVIGFTGSPGAGKSTLVDRLCEYLVKLGKKCAILAVDPSSPYSGGAILGDRIRMSHVNSSSEVFIRSMSSRGKLGGLAPRTSECITVLDAAGFDYILVETVGVGQGEVDIVRNCDVTVVVLVPGMGDSIQALKAGILEIADLFVINKADYDGADRLEKELLSIFKDGNIPEEKRPPIVRTIGRSGEGVLELAETLSKVRERARLSGTLENRKQVFLEQFLESRVVEGLVSKFQREIKATPIWQDALARLNAHQVDPETLAQELLKNPKS
jgi:LAO/AO transport system kinase